MWLVGLYSIVVTYCAKLSLYSDKCGGIWRRSYLSFVSGSHTGCQNAIFDATRREMIEYCMIRIVENTAVIFHRRRAVEDRFTQEKWKTWGRRSITNHISGLLEIGRAHV